MLDPATDDLRLRRLLCGKAPPFRRTRVLKNSSAQAGRLSLPACAEEHEGFGIGRKAAEAVKKSP
jgi:hypothetical protein